MRISFDRALSTSRSRGLSLVVALVLVAAALPALATHNDRRFENVGVADGLSEPTVKAIVQDRDGFIWFATDEGLNRYDGREMRVFRREPGSRTSLGSNRVSSLLIDSRGTLWIGTRGGGLSRFDRATERFETFRHDPENPESLSQDDIAAILEDSQKRIWIATHRGGINLMDTEGGAVRFVRFRHHENDSSSLSDDRTRCLWFDHDGTLWVGTMSGINRLVDEESGRFVHYRWDPADPTSISDDEVWSLLRDRDGVLWAGTWGGGLSRMKSDAFALPNGRFDNYLPLEDERYSLSGHRVMSIFEDSNGTIWAGTLASGVNELLLSEKDKAAPRFIHHDLDRNRPYGIAGSGISCAFEDRVGDLWLGTTGGVSRIDRANERFARYAHTSDDPDIPGPQGTISAILVDRRGAIWLGGSDGLDRIIPTSSRFDTPEMTHFREGRPEAGGYHEGSVSSLLELRDGTIMVGVVGGGLMAIPASETLADRIHFRYWQPNREDLDALASDAVLSLHQDPSGTLWVGTYRGLHRAVPGADGLPERFVRFTNDPDDPGTLSADTVESIDSSSDGTLWIGTYHGLNRFEPATGRATRYLPSERNRSSLSHEFIFQVKVTREGTVWAATWGGGLNRLDDPAGSFTTFGTAAGLLSEVVQGVEEGSGGALWIGTARGLCRLDPITGVVDSYTDRDGLHTSSIHSLAIDLEGRVIVGGDGGVTVFRPEDLRPVTQAPPVRLTELRILNEPVAIGPDSVLEQSLGMTDEIILTHDDYLLAFEFAALSYRIPERSRYAYKLEGFDPEWIQTRADDRKAVYSRVPPGRYVFRVRAANAEGIWNENGASVVVTILPPWWMTWWARSLAALLALTAAVSVPLLRLRRARALNIMLEKKVVERTSELAEANQALDEAARTDPLTGLPNRRDFLDKAEAQIASFRRTGRTFCISIADIDNFKSINDRYGHDCGDRVLRSISDVIRDQLRESDIVARWGGEEFIFLFPETEIDGARVVCDKIRESTARIAVIWNGAQVGVTVTLGLASVGERISIDDCTSQADAALYAGKRAGKNRVVTVGEVAT